MRRISYSKVEPQRAYRARRTLLLSLFFLVAILLVAQALKLQVLDTGFLQRQGDIRHMRVIPIPAHRGKILDRHGDPLAISTPVKSVWINPGEFEASDSQRVVLGKLLGVSNKKIKKMAAGGGNRSFVYLRRRIAPDLAARVDALGLPGLYFQTEYRRYYPAGEVASHLLGFTNIDDVGQEGLELAYEGWLNGENGRKRVIRDGKKRIIEDVELVRSAVAGQDLVLSIDRDLQYLAYRELKAAVAKHRARSGSLVLLDVETGEVLAMVNQPSFNPNSRNKRGGRRNRAVTDLFEPGSTMKPFAVACALDHKVIRARSVIDTSPGKYYIGRYQVSDTRNYGAMDVGLILQKSSNVGVSKIAQKLKPSQMWGCYDQLGFGRRTSAGFPGERAGHFPDYSQWHAIEQATLSFGYGLSTTTLQLARAYAAIANDGLLPEITFLKHKERAQTTVAISKKAAQQLQTMLETVVSDEGTAPLARVNGFRVAGKTGTVKKMVAGTYADDRYQSIFAGFAPVSQPRLAMALMIDDPSGEKYYGGLVAAPVFAKVMAGALRLLGSAPDQASDMLQIGAVPERFL